ncbi:hypothetical protein D3C87_22920 [compost metagenome]
MSLFSGIKTVLNKLVCEFFETSRKPYPNRQIDACLSIFSLLNSAQNQLFPSLLHFLQQLMNFKRNRSANQI